MMTPWRFATISLKRDWLSGELHLLAVALLLAVISITSVTFFTDRVSLAMQNQANSLLAADLAVESPYPLPPEIVRSAQRLELATSEMMTFRSVIEYGGKLQLTEVKAVDQNYPLRGKLEIADKAYSPHQVTELTPESGTAWGEQRLYDLLALRIGDAIQLGEIGLKCSKILAYEPDRGGSLFSIAPRLLINLADVSRSGLIQPGSRVTYRLLVAGPVQSLQQFEMNIRVLKNDAVKLIAVREARPELRSALDRAEKFLNLAALTAVLLSGISIASSARRFALRHYDNVAILRCMGAPQRFISSIFCYEMTMLGVIVGVIGALFGYMFQFILGTLMGELITTKLPAPSLLPAFTGILTGLVTLLGFSLPQLFALHNTPPARVLRRHLMAPNLHDYRLYLGSLVIITLLIAWHIGEFKLTSYIMLGLLITVVTLGSIAWCLIRIINPLRHHVGSTWRYGIANIARRSGSSIVQMITIGIGITLILLLAFVRTDLMKEWQKSLPIDAPNYYLINIQPQQLEHVADFLKLKNLDTQKFYPAIRARLIAINTQPVRVSNYSDPKAQRLVDRDFNLSWAQDMQAENQIITGQWWDEKTQLRPEFSVESELATSLNIKLGDQLTFRIADKNVTATVSNLRKVNWDSFKINFFVIATPGLLEDFAKTYITSVNLSSSNKQILLELVQKFRNITIIDTDAILTHVRAIMDNASQAIAFVFIFTLTAGAIVLISAIQSTHDERIQEAALLRTLGCHSKQIQQSLIAEFCCLGMVSGLLAVLAASTISLILANYVFHIPYHFNFYMLPVGLITGAVFVSCIGYLGTRRTLNTPPLLVLRNL